MGTHVKVNDVWDALCDDPYEAMVMKTKSTAFLIIRRALQEETLSEAAILEKYKITGEQLFHLIKGNISKFTVEKLLELVLRTGHQYDFVFIPKGEASPSGS